MREQFGGSAREEAAKKFNKEMKDAALNDAFRNVEDSEQNNKKMRGKEQEFDLEQTTEKIELDKEHKQVKAGVDQMTELGNEIELEETDDEKLELDK